MSADQCPRLRDCPKNELLAEKQGFESKCEILRTISQPWTLSADIPARQEKVYLFYYYPSINFYIARTPLVKKPVLI